MSGTKAFASELNTKLYSSKLLVKSNGLQTYLELQQFITQVDYAGHLHTEIESYDTVIIQQFSFYFLIDFIFNNFSTDLME